MGWLVSPFGLGGLLAFVLRCGTVRGSRLWSCPATAPESILLAAQTALRDRRRESMHRLGHS